MHRTYFPKEHHLVKQEAMVEKHHESVFRKLSRSFSRGVSPSGNANKTHTHNKRYNKTKQKQTYLFFFFLSFFLSFFCFFLSFLSFSFFLSISILFIFPLILKKQRKSFNTIGTSRTNNFFGQRFRK